MFESKLNSNRTFIDNPMCNEDPDCLLFITPRYVSGSNSNFPIGVFYNTELQKWEIFNQNGAGIPTNAMFNVLVIKQD